MNSFFTFFTLNLNHLLSKLIGPAAMNAVAGPVTWADLATMLVYLCAAAIVNVALVIYVRRRSGRITAQPALNTRHHLFAALGKPLYILVWICGIYLASTPVLVKLHPGVSLDVIQSFVDILFDVLASAAVLWFLFRATNVLEARVALWASATPSKIDDLLVPLFGSTLRVVIVVLGIILGIPLLRLPPEFAGAISKLTSIILILSLTVLLFRMVNIFQRVVLARFDMTAADNLRARKVYTQLHVISRVIYITIGIFAVSAILMLFQEVRHVGTSLLASAGILGIIAGFAAQKTLANLFAGFQIALAQPVRQDDVVVVEGEWGRVEEITLSYVIVHIWDDRRLVLPLSYFIEKPFQNWTRTSAAIMGSVFVWVDYAFPVEEARKALRAIVESSPSWDKRFWNLQVTDATERTIQLRVLATSSDSSKSWDLRCEIREKFISYIQRNHPSALPRFRADVAMPPVSDVSGC